MVEHAQPTAAADLGHKLAAAAAALGRIGDDLKAHVSHVTWEGEGGEAFRTWGSDLANATQRLSAFSGAAGTWMGHAAETLARVHSSMPEVSTASKTVLDAYRGAHPGQVGAVAPPLSNGASGGGGGLQGQGPTQQQAYAAQQRLDADRAEAARLMRQLAESYAWSAHQVQGAGRPVFPAIPGDYMPKSGDYEDVRHSPWSSGAGSQAHGEAGSATAASAADTQDSYAARVYESVAPQGYGATTTGRHELGTTSPVVGPPDQPVASRIDGATITPQIPIDASGPVSTSPPWSNSPVSIAPSPAVVAPAMNVRRGALAQPRQGVTEPAENGVGASTGTIGRVSPGQSTVSTPIGRVPAGASDGIIGGRPSPRGMEQPNKALPRGTVIGTEPSQGPVQSQGRSAMPHTPAAGPPTSSGNRPGIGSGRRLASEPGGVMGGSRRPQQGQASDYPFTRGGTGLVGEGRPRQESQQTGRRRPDYLVEDDETWTGSHRNMVPPVVD